MLPIVSPLSNVLVSVGEDHRAVAVLLALHEITLVALTVLVRQFAFAFKEVLAESALVRALGFSKVINTLTLEDAVDEVALVEAAIGPLVAPTAIFLSLVVLALEADLALLPRFGAHSMLMIVHPVTFVSAAF